MINTKLYQKRSRVNFFLITYGILSLVGLGLIILSVSRNQNPSSVEGFTLIFGAGMVFLTWSKSRKPRIIFREDNLEVNQQRNPQYIKYKSISNVSRTKDNRLSISVREGHEIKNVSVWLKDLENADADKLVDFCLKKGWKRH